MAVQELKLRNNPITDFSPLVNLFDNTYILYDLIIPDVNLRAAIAKALGKEDATASITFVEMASLTSLSASNKDIKDLTGIEHAINLEEIWVGKNPLFDLSPIAGLTNLVGISAWETPISDLSSLKDLTKLRWLDFGRTDVHDLSSLKGLMNLKKLKFYGCGVIEDLSPLEDLTALTEMNFGGNPISDLSPLAALVNLEHLDFHGDNIVDLSPLAGLNKLRHLDLRANSLSDVSALAGLTSLTNLLLGDNKISDVSPLAGLFNLEYLFLRENLITDISPLNNLHKDIYIDWLRNPGAPKEGPKLEGPWLCVLIPGKRLDSDTDLLADTSDGFVTEHKIATEGATEGKAVGDKKWTSHRISPTGRNNFKDVLRTFDVPPDQDTSDNVVYACIIIGSQQEQNTKLLLGSEGHHKIWLNGDLIHQDVGLDAHDSRDYGMFLPVTLKQGANIILVAIDSGHWITGHFGFEEGTEYTVVPPGIGFTFSTTATDLLSGDTFTLNLNAENITDLAGWQTDITFDPNVLEAVEVTEGDFLKSEGGDTFFQGGTIDNGTGNISTIFSTRISENGSSGTGALLSVIFKAKAAGETQVKLENFEFVSITDDIIPTVHPNITITVGEYPAWDVNQDGRVSILDLILVARDFGSGATANLRTDVNRDGVINIQDLIIVAQHMGETTDSAAPNVYVMDSKELTPAIVQEWIQLAQIEDDGSLAFQQGIENLQRLLASLLPEKTALLANYPNPFNPETWIPYQLAKPAEVTLTIYTINGSVIRILALGHQGAGIYQSRSRAAYWDGRNDVGEFVASGIYFYTLTTGDFIATRRMLILK